MAAEADSYTTEAHVVSYAQMGDYTTSTTPTQAQVLEFMERRAAEIYGWMVEEGGSAAPGPANYATSIDTSSDAGNALSLLCEMANAIGGAMDALEAAGASQAPARSERIVELGIAYAGMQPSIRALVKTYLGFAGTFTFTHISEGSIEKQSVIKRKGDGFTFTGTTEW